VKTFPAQIRPLCSLICFERDSETGLKIKTEGSRERMGKNVSEVNEENDGVRDGVSASRRD
jgi:hypothetical protein